MEEEIKEEEKSEEETQEETKQETAKTAEAGDKDDDQQEEKPLDKMTTPELKEIAKQIPGATGVTAMKKDALLAFIKEYRGIKDEEPPIKEKALVRQKASIKDLKQQVVSLRGDKKTAIKEKDRKKVNTLRRRINRLKKRTRKAGQA